MPNNPFGIDVKKDIIENGEGLEVEVL